MRPAIPPIHEHLATAVVLADEQLHMRYLNPAAEALFGVSARQMAGLPLARLAAGMKPLESRARQALATGAAYTGREHRVITLTQQTATVDATVTPLPDRSVLLELVHLDRHLRISREHRLLAQHQAIRELVRGLAHEIRNPLGGLRGAAQLLERALQDEDLREYTQVIIQEANRLQALVNGLLGPSDRPQQRSINIHAVMERVRQLVRAEAPAAVNIDCDYDPSIPPLAAEPDQLIQAVLNIVRNALQAVGDRGRITLRTRTQRRFTIGDTIHKLVVRIDVIDDGPGISPELVDRIFFPMVTTRPEGSGLGLPIAQTLISRHGGLIECASEPGRTLFTIWLPLEDEHG